MLDGRTYDEMPTGQSPCVICIAPPDLGQAAQSVARCDEQWRRQYGHIAMRRNQAIAKVAMARKLAVRLFWMWRRGWDYPRLNKFGSHVG